jgi:hypothetical protein
MKVQDLTFHTAAGEVELEIQGWWEHNITQEYDLEPCSIA